LLVGFDERLLDLAQIIGRERRLLGGVDPEVGLGRGRRERRRLPVEIVMFDAERAASGSAVMT
jgi:hypothetical protein